MSSLEKQNLPQTYSTTYSHGTKHNLRHGAHIQHLPIKPSTYSHGDDLFFKHILSLKIDSLPWFNALQQW